MKSYHFRTIYKSLFSIGSLTLLHLLMGCNNDSKKTASHPSATFQEMTITQPATVEDSLKLRSSTLEVVGDVNFPLTLTVDSLRAMNVVDFDSANIVCVSGAVTSKTISSRGVLLKDILNKAQVKQQTHKDRNFYIVAKATDGYKATYSWSEIFNNPTGENTYVIFEENGKPVLNRGAMILNTHNDVKTSVRHVIWLKSVEVHRVE